MDETKDKDIEEMTEEMAQDLAQDIAEACEEPAVTEEQLLAIARSEGLLDSTFDQAMTEGSESAESIEANGEAEGEGEAVPAAELTEAQKNEIIASIETILFMSDKAVSLPKLRATINPDIPLSVYRELMSRLRTEFGADHRGVDIAEMALGFQLRTKPHMAAVLRRMVKTQPLRLSPATMEVLAVIAYKQPVTKDEVDSIRGVDSGHVLRSLMERRLVRITGRSDLPGRPMLYGTTHEFLELFNLKDARQLPPLHEIEAMVATSEVGYEEKRQQVVEAFGKMVASSDRILFDDSKLDEELEAIRTEIASIPTSTPFIDEQKAKEKLQLRLAELAVLGLTLDAEGREVPIGYVAPEAASATETPSEHKPSPELEALAAEAQHERHGAMIAEAIGEAQQITQEITTQIIIEQTAPIADLAPAPETNEAPDSPDAAPIAPEHAPESPEPEAF